MVKKTVTKPDPLREKALRQVAEKIQRRVDSDKLVIHPRPDAATVREWAERAYRHAHRAMENYHKRSAPRPPEPWTLTAEAQELVDEFNEKMHRREMKDHRKHLARMAKTIGIHGKTAFAMADRLIKK